MRKAIFFLTIIFLTNIAGMYFGFYDYWWFDVILHFLGGFFMAMLMVRYLADIKTQSKLKNYLIIVGAVILIGVIWEFAEYLANQTLTEPLYNNFGIRTYFIGDLNDTLNDLLMDILGALSWLAIFRKK
ncbi:MAG: hypothetical protein AAB461_02180 [Patescibacteria group bacterium]